MGRTLAPKRPRYSMIFLMDFRMEVSMRPRRPSEVPDDCIIRCMDRRMCLRTAALATGISAEQTLSIISKHGDELCTYCEIHISHAISVDPHVP